MVAAVAVLVSGLVHLQIWFDGYRDFPDANLGRSFLANAIASVVVAGALAWRRDVLVRLAAMALLVATLVAFALSRTDGGIFGFSERGLNPAPQAALALVAELVGLALLAATFVPAIGAGRDLSPTAGAASAGVVVVVAVVGAVLWAQEPVATVTPPPTTAAPVTTAAPTTTASTATTGTGPEAPGSTTATSTPSTTAAPTTTTPAGPAVMTVSIADFAFVDERVEIPVGTTVEWVNEDSFAHSVVGDGGAFTSETLAPGDRFSFTFDAAGEFPYICGIHPSMRGTVVVTG